MAGKRLYLDYSRHADVGSDLYCVLWFACNRHFYRSDSGGNYRVFTNIGAYGSETIRAAISSVPKGQWEAGYTIGMTYMQTFRRIIAPQAFRVAVPPLSNTFIGLFKDTSLASVVTVTEMFRVAQQVANMSYDFLPVYIEAGLIYWCFCWVLFLIQARLEVRFNRFVAK